MDQGLLEIKNKIGEKKQISDTIYHTIKEGIANGYLVPGYRLKEETLAETFSVSRTPVREAIMKLEFEDLVTSTNLEGSIIKKLELDECLDTLEILEWLRSYAIESLLGRIPRSILMMLEQNMNRGELLEKPIDQYDNNTEFHDLLIKATGNSVLHSFYGKLSFKERIIVNTLLSVNYASDYVAHHRKLLKAIVESDIDYIEEYRKYNHQKADDYMKQLITHQLS